MNFIGFQRGLCEFYMNLDIDDVCCFMFLYLRLDWGDQRGLNPGLYFSAMTWSTGIHGRCFSIIGLVDTKVLTSHMATLQISVYIRWAHF